MRKLFPMDLSTYLQRCPGSCITNSYHIIAVRATLHKCIILINNQDIFLYLKWLFCFCWFFFWSCGQICHYQWKLALELTTSMSVLAWKNRPRRGRCRVWDKSVWRCRKSGRKGEGRAGWATTPLNMRHHFSMIIQKVWEYLRHGFLQSYLYVEKIEK